MKLKISRLRLEMTGVYLTRDDRRLSCRLFKADALPLKGTPYSPSPYPSPHWGEGHLAVGNSAACFILLIVYLSGRCIVKADALPLICEDRCVARRKKNAPSSPPMPL
ncbi:MAG TPA: hypothetical protein VKV29_09905 [Chthonomonas sp.]|uniref:hypothetical protein n=1 Tax=Chthonomonas sp. TaxID=2282153 RepID=UPI002B4AC3B2|nr:hypothetical protein [Chthonomonas sp.]HLH80581.1 hypothetical protein [Chthonomonas sp.]